MKIGIKAYGSSIPQFRLPIEETQKVWRNAMLKLLKHQLFINERAVTGPGQNAISLAVEAARRALQHAGADASDIDGLIMGSCTNPASYHPQGIEVARALGAGDRLFSTDIQFSTKSGTSAIQLGYALVRSKRADNVLAIGSDTLNRMTAPGTMAEYAASAGAGAVLLGSHQVIAEIEGTQSYNTDLSDEFRLNGEQHIRSGGFQSLAAALDSGFGIKHHIVAAVSSFLEEQSLEPADFAYVVFQQPYGIVPFSLGEALQFDLSKITPSNTAYELGNCGSASVMLGLACVLDIAKPDDRILVASYGSGAGSDVISLKVTSEIMKKKGPARPVEDLISDRQLLDYATAMIYEGKIYRSHLHHSISGCDGLRKQGGGE